MICLYSFKAFLLTVRVWSLNLPMTCLKSVRYISRGTTFSSVSLMKTVITFFLQ